ncbi:MAG: Nucleoside diphosphate kinase [Methanomassiliicoccales archaeon PtaU1.Bin124]|nr:MAG: Nucleoside diphosphate kinase [Methanomassiliicoccales archaeon PtaU1.Bin124]
MIERTFVMLKPDAVQRGLMGDIVARLERKGYKPVAMKLMHIPRELAERHYGEHKGKSFFMGLIDYITSGPVLVMVWEGENVVADMRAMMGKTNPKDALPGTIRGDFAQQTGRNIIHGSDSVESAKREIALFFNDYELQSWKLTSEPWLFE